MTLYTASIDYTKALDNAGVGWLQRRLHQVLSEVVCPRVNEKRNAINQSGDKNFEVITKIMFRFLGFGDFKIPSYCNRKPDFGTYLE